MKYVLAALIAFASGTTFATEFDFHYNPNSPTNCSMNGCPGTCDGISGDEGQTNVRVHIGAERPASTVYFAFDVYHNGTNAFRQIAWHVDPSGNVSVDSGQGDLSPNANYGAAGVTGWTLSNPQSSQSQYIGGMSFAVDPQSYGQMCDAQQGQIKVWNVDWPDPKSGTGYKCSSAGSLV
jgi:hypothetical protein